MLTNLDRRAAVLQVFRAMRRMKGPIYSFEYANALIPPLPDDFETKVLREATLLYAQGRATYSRMTARQQWRFAWQLARMDLKGY